jgi:cytoskeleton protein RodZ
MSEEHLMSEPPVSTQNAEMYQGLPSGKHVQSAGQMLRAAREASGLHIAALAVSMKVPVKKLEALEADRLDLLPDAVFVRALAASVCRTLKIESAGILEMLPQTLIPRLDADARSINAPFHSPGYAPAWTLLSVLKNPVFLVVLLLLAGALFVVFFPETNPTTVTSAAQHAVVSSTSDEKSTVDVSTPAQAISVPQAVVDSSNPGSGVETSPSSSVPVRPASPAIATVVAESLRSSPGLVSFKQRGPSWVEVTDAKGVVQLRKTLALGESVNVSGDLPLSVVVGRADVTDVEVRGKPFGLLEVAKDNVARFEVK